MHTPSLTPAKTLYQHTLSQLRYVYEEEEAPAVVELLLEEVYGISRMQMHSQELLDAERLSPFLALLATGMPLQQALGYAYFYGRKFRVSEAVLIPRRETEELVYTLLQRHQPAKGKRLLDIGTGSGCIALTLALELPAATVWGLDVSEEALAVAKENGKRLSAAVHWLQGDILNWKQEGPAGPWDIIVSNPPYVCRTEKEQMAARVLDFEPHLALFVPDEDPLQFYREIGSYGRQTLLPGGALYVEINEAYGRACCQLFTEQGYEKVALHVDMQGKDRIVEAFQPRPVDLV
ncbi:MAG: peptide chain release factor N(5)-glutamine methyltransferase [Nitritalea sp.]